MAQLIDGKAISAKVRSELSKDIQDYEASYGRKPGLAVILVGQDPASQVYVRNKHRACVSTGLESVQIELSEEISEADLLKEIDRLNQDPKIDGIIVQLPLPKHINPARVQEAIALDKDVDGFRAEQLGRLFLGQEGFAPCTPAGVMRLLDEAKVDLDGKRAVIVGRSAIVGKPQAALLLERNATVTICHSHTQELASVTREADVLIVAVGQKRLIQAEHVKKGAVVIDVGIHREDDGHLCGDVHFDAVLDQVSQITPVPGGVGPMTIAMLLSNTVKAWHRHCEN